MALRINRNATALFAFLLLFAKSSYSSEVTCKAGVYLSEHNNFVVIAKRAKEFRFLKSDGNYGVFDPQSSSHSCYEESIFFEDKTWSKKMVSITNTRFDSQGVTLAGQLIMPESAGRDTPLVVYAHGSERTGWIESALEPYQLLARGISVFVYDKRGTGLSQGKYNQNFPTLAKDLVAASHEARRLASGKYGRFGLVGLSQGGWIAPLASNEAKADFIVIGYGLVADFTEEDYDQVMLDVDKLGVDEKTKDIARKITGVTARMIKSNYRDGIEEFALLQKKYGNESWFKAIKGSYTGVLLSTKPNELLEKGIPAFDSLDVDWTLDPVSIVKNVNAPQYWALAELDSEAPAAKTIERLLTLKKLGKDISMRVFPNSDHGMWLVDKDQVAEGYFDSQADFVKGALGKRYGDSWIPQKN